MQSKATNVSEYIIEIPEERQQAFSKLRQTILENIPKGFEECMIYGMVGYVVPHSIYPKGYHCDPKLPLSFTAIASQKNFIALYHMGICSNPKLLEWFTSEFAKHSKKKLDMGKSCMRFKKPEDIPFELIGELMQKMTVEEWINAYESVFKK
ncbi:DUF1801 domain-containing protein [Flavobacterium sp.]|uniref:DUF1801 domain-containing protein n=1 Tax=Flavobacterium sp. TaxID=239 RepID=UPI00374FEBB5